MKYARRIYVIQKYAPSFRPQPLQNKMGSGSSKEVRGRSKGLRQIEDFRKREMLQQAEGIVAREPRARDRGA